MNYNQLYQLWTTRKAPSDVAARMTRRAIQYVTDASCGGDWGEAKVLPLQHALVILDAAMA